MLMYNSPLRRQGFVYARITLPSLDDFPRFVIVAPGDDLKLIMLEPTDWPGPILVLQKSN